MAGQALKYRTPRFIKVYNSIAKPDLKHYLSFDKLIIRARKKARLKYFGSDFWDEPLKQLLHSAVNEANFSPFGAFLFREKLKGQLVNRLRADDWFRKKPEILEQELLPVYLITGLQRTGTTRLQRLISQQTNACGLHTWEALNPAPIGQLSETKKRISQGNLAAKSVKWMAPDFNSIHPILPLDFEEDVLLLDVTFQSTAFEAILNVPSFSEWLTKHYNECSYGYELKLLKLLQFNSKKKYWVLKSPHHLEFLDVFKKVMKPEKIIWTHRDIQKTIPSLLSMIYYSRGLFQKDLNLQQVIEHWYPKMIKMVSLGMKSYNSDPNGIEHINYKNWTKDERGTLTSLLNISENEVHINSSAHYRSKHNYSLEDFDLTASQINKDFRNYLDFTKTLKF